MTGDDLRALRVERGLSLVAMADKMWMHKAQLCNLEHASKVTPYMHARYLRALRDVPADIPPEAANLAARLREDARRFRKSVFGPAARRLEEAALMIERFASAAHTP